MSVINLQRSRAIMLITHDGHTTDNMQWSETLVENSNFFIPQLHLTPSVCGSASEYCRKVWYGKTSIVWLPNSAKILKTCLLVLTEDMNMIDGRTDGQPPHGTIGCTYAQHRTAETSTNIMLLQALYTVFLTNGIVPTCMCVAAPITSNMSSPSSVVVDV